VAREARRTRTKKEHVSELERSDQRGGKKRDMEVQKSLGGGHEEPRKKAQKVKASKKGVSIRFINPEQGKNSKKKGGPNGIAEGFQMGRAESKGTGKRGRNESKKNQRGGVGGLVKQSYRSRTITDTSGGE